MKWIKKVRTCFIILLFIPIVYGIISIICTYITVNSSVSNSKKEHTVYLSSNGVHLEIIIPKELLHAKILDGVHYQEDEKYFSFGWGDKNFYIKTPTWADLTCATGFKALFLNTSSLLHVTRHYTIKDYWIPIHVNQKQLNILINYIDSAFALDADHQKIVLNGLGHSKNDDFFEANENYHCFRTCNTWINNGFKKSGIKACLWTPYDFRLIDLHQP